MDGMEGALSTIQENYCAQLCKLDEEQIENIEIVATGAGLGGGFDHTSKSKVLKYKQAINGPDGNKWIQEIESEHARMVSNGV